MVQFPFRKRIHAMLQLVTFPLRHLFNLTLSTLLSVITSGYIFHDVTLFRHDLWEKSEKWTCGHCEPIPHLWMTNYNRREAKVVLIYVTRSKQSTAHTCYVIKPNIAIRIRAAAIGAINSLEACYTWLHCFRRVWLLLRPLLVFIRSLCLKTQYTSINT